MPSCTNPIFIIGTERSGSNLLRLILDAHNEIVIPHPPHLMKYFGPLNYGNLEDEKHLLALASDMVRLIESHIFPWEVQLDPMTLIQKAPKPNHFGLIAAIYEEVLSHHGKSRWGCKSTFMVHYVHDVLSVYPDAQFILLVRDPRDVAVSARKSVFSPCHPYLSALLWDEQQRIGEGLQLSLKRSQMYTIRYEDLLVDPNTSMRQLCDFLGTDYSDEMMKFFEQKEAKKSASLSESWGNTARPIMRNNHQKFKTELSKIEIAMVEQVCQKRMKHFGYALTNNEEQLKNVNITNGTKLSIQVKEQFMRTKIEWRSLNRDKNHWRRWRRDATAKWFAWQHR